MTTKKEMHDLFFEVSHEDRYGILQILQKKAMRITDIAKEMNINNPEARRHLSRLSEIGLIQRDVEGLYNLSSYGEACLSLFSEFDFLSTNRDYFGTHSLSRIPVKFLKRVGELLETKSLLSALDFFRHTENLFRESRSFVWLLVDQFPMNSISSIMDSIERGVKYRIIEPRDRILDTDYDALSSEESRGISRTRGTPLIEQRMIDEIDICMFISDSNCVFAFPTSDGKYDYVGFSGTDELTLNWCKELYKYYWDESESRKPKSLIQIERGRIATGMLSRSIVVEGKDNPRIDAQAVQDAVDNYDEVLLRGIFNFGSFQVRLSKSVIVKGDGREKGIPKTTIYKKGWSFPFREWDAVFMLDADDIDVTIENINFTDFNCACVCTWPPRRPNSLKVLNNRITLNDGFGRGITYGAFGDFVHGILAEGFGLGGVLIEGNFIDLGSSGIARGSASRGGLEDSPEYRPDLFNHEYYVGFGIAVNGCSGKVEIRNNVVRNANGRGIAVSEHLKSIEVIIRDNVIESDVYGSYPFSSRESGAGIVAHTGLAQKNIPGFYVCIEKNTVNLDKLNYSGILVLGPTTEGSSKLHSGIVRENNIHLKNGYEGIHLRKCDDFDIAENKISGEAYYGIRISGRKKVGEIDQRALNNLVEGNDMEELQIRGPDNYSDNHADGRRFASSPEGSATAHVWLDKFSKNNSINIRKDESIIDEGEDNITEYS